MSASSSASPAGVPSAPLLCLSQSLLRRILLHVDADSARAVAQTCTMKAHATPTQTGAAASSSLRQFFSSLASQLDDREVLARDAAARARRFKVQGYKEGLDATNTRAEEQSLMQVPFTAGFHAGARVGWRNAVASGRIAALACMLALDDERRQAGDARAAWKDPLMDDSAREEVFRVNREVNSKLIAIPPSTTAGASADQPPPLEPAAAAVVAGPDAAAAALARLSEILRSAGLASMLADQRMDLPPMGMYTPEAAAQQAASSSATTSSSARKPVARPTRQAAAPPASVEASQMAALDW